MNVQVVISELDSNMVEKIFYEYQASLNILSYLMKQQNINEKYLNEYFKKSELYYIELEIIKKQMIKKYYNNQEENQNNNYYFDFNKHILNIIQKDK